MTVPLDPQAVLPALAEQSSRVARSVRGGGRLGVPVPGLAWTAGQLAAHLASVYQAFAGTVSGEFRDEQLDRVVAGHTTLPTAIAAANAYIVDLLATDDPAAAADALETGAGKLLAVLRDEPDFSRSVPTPWYDAEMTRTVGTLAALAVSETLVHGYDMARALRVALPMSAASAAAVAPTVMSEMLPLLLDAERAEGFVAGFELRVRGGKPFALYVADGVARSAPAGGPNIDCVISLHPCSALLIGFRRVSLRSAALTGRAFAFGRRPWLSLRFHELFQTP
jgi:uncharacterized protein (TIGR03083 family)